MSASAKIAQLQNFSVVLRILTVPGKLQIKLIVLLKQGTGLHMCSSNFPLWFIIKVHF